MFRDSEYRSAQKLPDLTVLWGVKKRRFIQPVIAENKNFLIMERAYVGDRHSWTSLGYNGLNGEADFLNADKGVDFSRVDKHHWGELLGYFTHRATEPKRILIVGQVKGDASLGGIDITDWYDRTIKKLKKLGYYIIFRNHPLESSKYSSDLIDKQDDSSVSLEQSLQQNKIFAVVTYSSNSGVISCLSGYRTYYEGFCSMIKDSGFSTNNIEKLEDLWLNIKQRNIWLTKMSWCQWTKQEIASGEAWDHLKGKILYETK